MDSNFQWQLKNILELLSINSEKNVFVKLHHCEIIDEARTTFVIRNELLSSYET